MNGTATAISTCPTKKKQFTTETAATDFIADILIRYPHQAPQYPYLCDSCNLYHLSTQSPESYGMQDSRQSLSTESMQRSANANPNGVGSPRGARATEETKLQAFKMRDQGKTMKTIADELGHAYPTISTWLNDPRLQAIHNKTKIPTTVEQFETEEQKLERQLADIRAKKQAAIEAKKWKFLRCWDGKGVLLQKEGNQLGVLLEDAEELVVMLDEYLQTARQQ
jgi:hypothetical protein